MMDARPNRALSVAYPLILGGVVSALIVTPVGIGGDAQIGAWLYIAIIIGVVTFTIGRLLRVPFDRWAPPGAFLLIPLAASVVGVLVGSWALHTTMGGPTGPPG